MNWAVENYQLVIAGITGIFGIGAGWGSLRGRLKTVEKKVEKLDERFVDVQGTLGKVQQGIEMLHEEKKLPGFSYRPGPLRPD